MRILFTGGGTGGHFFPLIAVIRELKQIAEEERIADLSLFYMGPQRLGKEVLREERVISIPLMTGKFRRYLSLMNIVDFFKLLIGTVQAFWNMFFIMPDVVFSKGGYGALPAVIAAALLKIPLIIHESDAVAGRVNRFSARFADRIGIAFEQTAEFFPKEKTARVGIPVRRRILGGNRERAKENLDIFSTKPVVAIMGGSQGALKLNNAVLEILKELTDDYEVIHLTGAEHFNDISSEARVILESYHHERYHSFAFLDEGDLRDFYTAADLVVSRAGASSIFEIAASGKPSMLIPLRNAAQDHQRKNAYEYASTGAAAVIEETNLTPHILLAEIKKHLENHEELQNMGHAAQRFARIDSGELIAREILKLALH